MTGISDSTAVQRTQPAANAQHADAANRRGPNFSARKYLLDPATKFFKAIGGGIKQAATSLSKLPSMLRARPQSEGSFTIQRLSEVPRGNRPSGLPPPLPMRPGLDSFTPSTLGRSEMADNVSLTSADNRLLDPSDTRKLDHLEAGSELSETPSEEAERVLRPTVEGTILARMRNPDALIPSTLARTQSDAAPEF